MKYPTYLMQICRQSLPVPCNLDLGYLTVQARHLVRNYYTFSCARNRSHARNCTDLTETINITRPIHTTRISWEPMKDEPGEITTQHRQPRLIGSHRAARTHTADALGPDVTMETVVIVAIGVLATIFLASFVALVVVCRHRYCHPHHLLQHLHSKPNGLTCWFEAISLWIEQSDFTALRPNIDLIGAMETQSEPSELELDDVVITNPHIEAILENEDWIEDASGLVSHCISILKICHTLTEKLVAMTMGSGAKVKAPASLSDIINVAKRISPRVDDVVRSMYPPLDPILLDARATALLLSVSHLVLVTRNACHMSGSMDWIDQSLHAAEDHMVVLREAALASEPERRIPGTDLQREQAI
ncbi:hypothetical protein DPEC_G00276780 [Dallia pectoralis]|uniref:Uncharacterized protein n=1 Tax=Dallia pectoralis TaxID=75939 RepID=A0ACC2FM16_DALPE|nr:hypothetical protein DPEC_G00276780 [Dallia pectoralis]